MAGSDGATPHSHQAAKCVLVVEDDLAIRRLAMDLLEDEGYDVRTADSGAAALEIMETWRPDLIVLDLMMPVMDGPTFHANLPDGARDIPILVLSGSRTARETAAALGAVAVIAKPFDIQDLLTQVARAL